LNVPVLTGLDVCSLPLSLLLTYRSSHVIVCLQFLVQVPLPEKRDFFVDEFVIHISNLLAIIIITIILIE
jgi:hypothetical protein